MTLQYKEPEYKPQIFNLSKDNDVREVLRLKANSCTQVFDTIQGQLRDLITTRHPSQKLTSSEIDELMEIHLEKTPLEQYGVWVYYPWSYRLVHILDESEFVELRTNRNKYKISLEEQRLLSNWKVGIVGLSTGQSVALTLALERGFGELRIADFDSLDLSNMNRIPTGIHNLGLPKVYVTAREIAEIDPFLKVVCFPDGLTSDNLDSFLLEGGKLDLAIEECDSLDIKLELRLKCRAHKIPVIMGTSDRGMLDVERFDLEPNRPLFHGLIEGFQPEHLRELTTEEKVPYILKIFGLNTFSLRGRASLVEVGQSIKTWPQLASSVVLGGAVVADVSRRIAIGQSVESDRYFIDLDRIIGTKESINHQDDTSQQPSCHPDTIAEWMIEASHCCKQQSWRATNTVELSREQLFSIIQSAIAAPSDGNAQPWRWVYINSLLLLFLDKTRTLPNTDFHSFGAIVGLGAAAENVVITAHHYGFEVYLKPFPLVEYPDLVAAFEFTKESGSIVEPHVVDELYEMIDIRHTNRRYDGHRSSLLPLAEEAITSAVRSVPGASVQFLQSDDALNEIGHLIGAGDRLRFINEELHRECFSEIRWTKQEEEELKDGLLVDTLELKPTDRVGLEVCKEWQVLQLVNEWGGGAKLEETARKIINTASAVALITMPQAKPTDYFQGGRAVQRGWLVANQKQYAIQPMTILPYLFARLIKGQGEGMNAATRDTLKALRSRYCNLFDVTDETGEIMLLKLARADKPTGKSLRRPVDEVLTILA